MSPRTALPRPFHVLDRVMGDAAHEMSIVRMGRDSKTSALNAFRQTHGVGTLFVTDALGFDA